MQHFDLIIVGGGIGGLYAAYTFIQKYPTARVLVLEKNNRFGGRIYTENFCGTEILLGAGILRKDKDIYWLKLLQELNIQYQEFPVQINYAQNIHPVNNQFIFNFLREKYNLQKHVTFKKYALKILGKTRYNQFIDTIGYTDFEEDDAYEVLNRYGLEDTISGWTGIGVKWKLIIDKILKFLKDKNVATKKNQEIQKIEKQNDKYILDSKYATSKLILATDINGIQSLVSNPIYADIKGQSFIRVYAKFDKRSNEIMKQLVPTYTVVKQPLQKIIPISHEKGVYMIAYADNDSADYLKPYLDINNKKIFEQIIKENLNVDVKILKMRGYYWNIGTHYYTPLKHGYKTREEFIEKIQRPYRNMWIVGEAVSYDHGWTHGALDSVECIKDEF